jgi:molybdopterin/thiamine biosynthesis adenylyltransferase
VPVTIVGRRLKRLARPADATEPWFHRQRLALGAAGQAELRRLRIAVVGLGGIGSVVAMQLCHLGVGELVLVDGDLLEASNVSRVLAARVSDVGRMPKVELAARYVGESGLPVRVHTIGEHLGERNLDLLASADVIISCVDRHRPRALLNRLAYRAMVPLIDTGTAFRVDTSGRMTGDAGRVVVVGPGKPCLACWGHISPDALRLEALKPEEREALADEGYVSGADVPEPSVIAFNAAVASHAVIELMRMVTGFAGAEEPPERLAFSFRDGTVRRNRLGERRPCSVCNAQ